MAAASSCTGWNSTIVPPQTIRVGRADGSVDVVNFRRYVGVVMAKEWPSWMPKAALQAGATAVKQYGWWYTLAGKHRSTYRNAAGECFDVRDSTVDQLFRPESVTVTDKIWRAVDATLNLSVRKGGKFFMTGYRAGKSGVCASDADGWKLFAKSVIDCAEKGWTREEIQTAYYAPDVTFHWAGDAPAQADVMTAISAPRVSLRAGMTLGQKHVKVVWDHDDARPKGTTYQLQRLIDGSWKNVTISDPTQSSIAFALAFGDTHRFRVRLRDASGATGPWFAGPAFDARLAQESKAAFAWTAGWKKISTSSASGGTARYATAAGSTMAFTFTGRAVGLVGTVGPNRGRARVYVDGTLEAEVDLYAASNKWRVLVFTRQWSDSVKRVIRVEVVGTSGRPRVDVDAVVFHR